MYRRPKFLEVLLEIRREMALEADYDVDLFAELARSGKGSSKCGYSIASEDGSNETVSVEHGVNRRRPDVVSKK